MNANYNTIVTFSYSTHFNHITSLSAGIFPQTPHGCHSNNKTGFPLLSRAQIHRRP